MMASCCGKDCQVRTSCKRYSDKTTQDFSLYHTVILKGQCPAYVYKISVNPVYKEK